jgi:hypothetical protein
MSTFKNFKSQLQKNFEEIIKGHDVLFVTDVEKDAIWNTYLNSYPEDEKQGYNCNSCRQFLKPYANIVVIGADYKLKSIWDFKADAEYAAVAENLNKLVTSAPIKGVFVTKVAKLGTDFNHQKLENGEIIKWEHFHFVLPSKFVDRSSKSEESVMADYVGHKDVFKRSLNELTQDSVETVLELIAQNSLYRGIESKEILEIFLKHKKAYTKLSAAEKDNYAWANSVKASGAVTKIRNNSIGTLLINLSEGKDLDFAVTAFEKVMCPANYKRPNAIVTKKMVEDAEKTIDEMGLRDSLGRRYAHVDDITVNNVLFVDRGNKKLVANVFDELKEDALVNPKKLSKVEEISIDDFIKNVVPKATGLELLFENQHTGNLVSLIAPKNAEAPSLFKWNNNFSWSYVNNVTDSIKENVKAAGGNVSGVLRFSIQWNDKGNNNIDFDAHAVEPNGHEIFYGASSRAPGMSQMSGQLDVDIVSPNGKVAVENITWVNKSKMGEGKYKFFVENYSSATSNGGFTAEVEYDGEVYSFAYPKNLRGKERVNVMEFMFSKTKGITVIQSLDSNSSILSRDIWGVQTSKFQKVNMLTVSPNFWDEQTIGNKHYFFILDKCLNSDTSRGFYNEFLKEELMKQKRVFEALGDKLKVEHSDQQLSGVGFSTTNKTQIICRVTGTFSRTLKINF